MAGWRCDPVGRETTFNVVLAAVAALLKSFYIRQNQADSDLGRVCALCDQRRLDSVLVQVDVADAVTWLNVAVEVNRLPSRKHKVR